MDKRLNRQIESYVGKFKTAIKEKVIEMKWEDKEKANDFVSFVYNYERLVLSKEDIIESEEDKFNQFHSWVREQLENAKFLEYKRFISKYKSLYFNSDDLFSAFHLLLMGILNLNFLLRYANERIVGEKICKHLAKSWIKKVP